MTIVQFVLPSSYFGGGGSRRLYIVMFDLIFCVQLTIDMQPPGSSFEGKVNAFRLHALAHGQATPEKASPRKAEIRKRCKRLRRLESSTSKFQCGHEATQWVRYVLARGTTHATLSKSNRTVSGARASSGLSLPFA